MLEDLPVTRGVTLSARDMSWKAVRSPGPGGQNVNKVASKVELRFALGGATPLRGDVLARLRVIARGRLDAEGRILITSDRTRDRQRNLEDAREKLRALVAQALEVPKARRATRPTRGSVERRLEAKKSRSRTKEARRSRPDD